MSLPPADTEADFLQMLSDHRAMLYKIIRSYCAVESDYADLEQEIVLQLWRSFDNYDGRVKRSTWVYRVAFNVAITHLRRRGTRKKYETDPNYEPQLLPALHGEEDPVLQERIERLQNAIRRLSAADRPIILLYLDGKSYEEIAAIVGISATNVGTKLYRIRNRLRDLITNET